MRGCVVNPAEPQVKPITLDVSSPYGDLLDWTGWMIPFQNIDPLADVPDLGRIRSSDIPTKLEYLDF
jgi:hypothetical protein